MEFDALRARVEVKKGVMMISQPSLENTVICLDGSVVYRIFFVNSPLLMINPALFLINVPYSFEALAEGV